MLELGGRDHKQLRVPVIWWNFRFFPHLDDCIQKFLFLKGFEELLAARLLRCFIEEPPSHCGYADPLRLGENLEFLQKIVVHS